MRKARVALVAAVLALLVAAWRLGLFTLFSSPAAARVALLQLGPWGYVAFVLAYAALQPFGVPGTVFVMVAPLIWPWPVAFALSMIGTMAASVVGFSFARFVGREWLAERIPARLRRYDEALEKRAFVTVALLRFLFWMPQVLHTFLGLSRVPFWTHFWGSAVGYVVPLLAVSYFGQRFFDAMTHAPTWVWVALGAAVAVGLMVWAIRWAARRPRGASATD